jgi:hypothetical protein
MLRLELERLTLVQADRDIEQGEARIERQRELIKHMLTDGRDIGEALVLLNLLRDTLTTWREHRDEIIKTIARLEALPHKADEPLVSR